jgi:hypothetical protein
MSKKITNKHIIWSNYNLNLDDWMEGIKEILDLNGIDYSDWPESKFENEMWILNREYFYDEQANLNIPTEGRIIEIADVGLWDGRRVGYKLLNEHNIRACLNLKRGCEYGEWWVDSHNNLRSSQTHHDATHYILYREVKPEISSDQLDNFCWKLYRGKATSKDITKYTHSLGKRVKDVYGW